MYDTIESAELFDSVFDSMEIFLAIIALITLSLGGVGVMNTMMMAVSERTNEIGLKKALGATNRRILVDFFLEGLMLALFKRICGSGPHSLAFNSSEFASHACDVRRAAYSVEHPGPCRTRHSVR